MLSACSQRAAPMFTPYAYPRHPWLHNARDRVRASAVFTSSSVVSPSWDPVDDSPGATSQEAQPMSRYPKLIMAHVPLLYRCTTVRYLTILLQVAGWHPAMQPCQTVVWKVIWR